MEQHTSPFINKPKKKIEFHIQNRVANNIALIGSFSHWRRRELKPDKDGLWKVTIPMLPNGKYYYKFIIDERMWVEDVDNPNREPDGVNGWNSVLMVEVGED